MKKLLAILIMILSFSACDESTNPSDDSYAIEKTLTENAITQEFTSGDDIKITVTGGTINVETEIKVKKVSASDVPNLTLDKTVIGKNIFKIKIKGQKTFSPALKIEIKYDDVYLKSKNLTTADIKGLVHLPSGWVLGDYTIDQANKKIIFSISSTSLPSKQKDGLLDDEDEITICDGYTTIDSGQGDEILTKLKYFDFNIDFTAVLKRQSNSQEFVWDYSKRWNSTTGVPDIYDTCFVNWYEKNKFIITFIEESNTRNETFTIGGEVNKTDWTLKNLTFNLSHHWSVGEHDALQDDIKIKFKPMKGTFFEVPSVKVFQISYDCKDENKKYNLKLVAEEIIWSRTQFNDNNIIDILTTKEIVWDAETNKFWFDLENKVF